MYENTPIPAIAERLLKAQEAFNSYKNYSLSQRAHFMRSVADAITNLGDELIETAKTETHLPEARLIGEKARTVFQWNSYAEAIERGTVLDIRINTAQSTTSPPKPDLRKTMVPLGIVTVFGASNFPFAFSTAGGDTASAIAAGCAVVVKAHPAHPKTAALMGEAILQAARQCNLPDGVFSQVFGDSFETGTFLVNHPLVKAVGFTGSFQGGKALFDLAAKRPEPIPVFAEMSSINPVFLLPGKLEEGNAELAGQYVASLTLGTGQFCTNPGLLIVPESDKLNLFTDSLATAIKAYTAGAMLHPGIAHNYEANLTKITGQPGVDILAEAGPAPADHGRATLAGVQAADFLANNVLQEEVFGPFGLLVQYRNEDELNAIARALEGQLTSTLLASQQDLADNKALVDVLMGKCGRLLFNQFPTGVEVCLAMQHGGPYPATTDSRFTSVGPDAIKRFIRPVSYQNWPDEFLPDELKNGNPLKLWRTVNNELSREAI